jgi:hypothetical protein
MDAEITALEAEIAAHRKWLYPPYFTNFVPDCCSCN